jgi:hypothetical protein
MSAREICVNAANNNNNNNNNTEKWNTSSEA